MLRAIACVGSMALGLCESLGSFILFFGTIIKTLFSTKLNVRQLFIHMKSIGIDSSLIIILTGFSAGLALALQTYIGFRRFHIEEFIGTVVALGMTRELGPVLTGLMVTGRAGSAMAAEIGTMKISEQIDALRTLCIDPFQYLVVPRILAGVFILPFLTIFSMICGIAGGYMYCVQVLGVSAESYISGIHQFVELSDIHGGLIKSSCFGLLVAWIGTYNGFQATGGARGVGIATTRTVVASSILILIANYFLSILLHNVGIS